jgi:hypothetical protein
MLKLDEYIQLKSKDTFDKLSFRTLYLVQVNFTFSMTFQNDNFSGIASFCVRKDQIVKFCSEFNEMKDAQLFDNDSDAFIEVVRDYKGLLVRGQIGGTHEDVYMQYNFLTEPVSMNNFSIQLENLLDYVDDEEYEGQYNFKNKPK